jgi:hypothetical protein
MARAENAKVVPLTTDFWSTHPTPSGHNVYTHHLHHMTCTCVCFLWD